MKSQLASERVRLGYTQQQMANAVDVHIDTIKRWEKNPAGADVQALKKIANLCGCSIDYLVGVTPIRQRVS